MKIDSENFRVRPGRKVRLEDWPTRIDPYYRTEKQYRAILDGHVALLSQAQSLLYASNRHAVLVIFQSLDAGGKDGAIKHVMSGVNPQGCEVHSFKHPSVEEQSHDFLWRSACRLPERGRIGIFNRSYYEDVLIVRVHPKLLLPPGVAEGPPPKRKFWEKRYRSIVGFERHLDRAGTRIVKFFLHLSKEEQRRRFLARIDDPEKNWKLSRDDIEERKFWPEYAKAYEACLAATSTKHAPWFIIPADDKENARLIVSRVLLDAFEGLNLEYPRATPEHRAELEAARQQLKSEA